MSAIWGMVDFQKASGNESLARRMEEPLHKYKIDTFQKHVTSNTLFGYGGQYFTKEARNEIQPIIDESGKIKFVADVVLDNREELFELLEMKSEKQNDIPDGTLMYLMIRKFGKKSFNMFLGTYAFAYYDSDKKEILLVTDAVGSRSLYFYYEYGKMYFSTLIKPIIAAKEGVIECNYRFLTDYLALDNFSLYTETEETPYLNLYKVAPGQAVIINEQGIHKEDYWKPHLETKPLHKRDEDVKNDFIKLFDLCVSSVMRSSDNTGILLSGGLDSTSVACFAAPILKNNGEMLYSYTSIPENEYISKESPYFSTNEQKMVEITKNYLGNLCCSFLDLPGMNGYDGAIEYMDKFELPYKSLQNVKWMHESADKAAKDGCRILLTGQYGNATISFGDFDMLFYSLFKSGHIIKLVKEVNAFKRKYHIGGKKIYRYILTNFKANLFMNKNKNEDGFENVYVNSELLKKYDTKNRFQNNKYNDDNKNALTFQACRPFMINKKALIQIGEFETRLSLTTGVLPRDPTKDKRIIEFCINLPGNQFVSQGTERRLVREYLADYMPKEVCNDYLHRGLQSADTTERIDKNWEKIYRECITIIENDIASNLLDIQKVKLKLEVFKKELPNNSFELVKLLYSILMVKYVEMIKF